MIRGNIEIKCVEGINPMERGEKTVVVKTLSTL